MDTLISAVSWVQDQLFEQAVQPLLFHLGLASWIEDGYRATLWAVVGLLQLAVLLAVIRPLQKLWPAEPLRDPGAVRVDVIYTLIHRLGLFRLGLFFTVEPLWDALFGWLHLYGITGVHLDQLWPGVTDLPWLSLLIYLLVFDFADYLLHVGQHRWRWWWALHALHHSQRQMTMWSDNRGHLLDDLLRDGLLVLLAQCIGVAPGQFVAVVAITQLLESLSHANVRFGFGRIGDRLLVSPRFHRGHHAMHLEAGSRGHNYAVLFPVWDIVFGTARYSREIPPTGIADQLPEAGGRDYGQGFWAQQWLGLKRMAGRG
ncbi:sterol desaturase family protein [Caldimonas tepidiphila]|uniref:sterol desaturase family protein n=1 Tax=Caldimonas tepidiphila TaxID=2315841 RepID=UPI000E5B2D8C|nr:sterol desaturase family protein [Caldimonas tepidiphila]